MKEGIFAVFTTPKGTIKIRLTHKETPGTVGNFVALAEGNLENSHKAQGNPYYDGMTFHRVIENFMIQGGCPCAWIQLHQYCEHHKQARFQPQG